jgi:hypothetical protein
MQTLAEIVDYNGLIEAIRARADELNLSRETIDDIAGLAPRYANKLLSRNGPKRIGIARRPVTQINCGARRGSAEAQPHVPRQEYQVRHRGKGNEKAASP